MSKEELDLMIKNEEVKLNKLLLNKQKDREKINKLQRELYKFLEQAEEKKSDMIKETEREKTLLERAEEIGKVKKDKRLKPAKVIEIVENNYVVPYDEKYDKLLHYAQKYKIKFFEAGRRKSYKDLAHDIHDFELKNKKKILNKGLDKEYKEFGMYIKSI